MEDGNKKGKEAISDRQEAYRGKEVEIKVIAHSLWPFALSCQNKNFKNFSPRLWGRKV
jgi:hypothetical protein